jgi:hypothetical protein
MNIIRVIEDGVEFFTVDTDGDSGLSIAGIARSIGLDRSTISKLIKRVDRTPPLVNEDAKKSSKHHQGKPFTLVNRDGSPFIPKQSEKSTKDLPDMWSDLITDDDDDENIIRSKQLERFYGNVPILATGGTIAGKNVGNLKIYRYDFCAAILRHYAYRGYPKAQYLLDRFSDMGMLGWIQKITGWKPPEPAVQTPEEPKLPDFSISRDIIRILKNDTLTPTAYRLCLHLYDVGQLGDRPAAAKICKDLNITRTTYHKTTRQLAKLKVLPNWLALDSRNYPERMVRDWLHGQLGGQIEAPTIYGPIDLLTEEEVIEVKAIEDWKDAIGHVIVKGLIYPDKHKCLMLFGDKVRNFDQIKDCCHQFGIQVGLQLIKYLYDEADELLAIQRVGGKH